MRKLILHCGLSPGDIVMMTAAVRDLHRWYPGRFQTDVRTRCPELWENNPYLTRLREEDPAVEWVDCSYPLINYSNRRPFHCLHGFCDFLGQHLDLTIPPTLFKGDIHLSEQEKSWHSQVYEVTGRDIPFWIVAAGGKYDVTIKWWEAGRYQDVVDHFRGRVQFVQVGSWGHHHPRLDGVIDLRGQTSLRELIRLVYHADGVLCSVTALMHLAAAVESHRGPATIRPCVVVAGGREPAHWEAYPGHQFIHTNAALDCCKQGGCWKDRVVPLRDGDPRDRPEHRCRHVVRDMARCLDLIPSEEVVRRIELYHAGGRIEPLTARQWQAAQRGIRATHLNPYDQQPLNLHSAGLACDDFVRKLPGYPGGHSGRGIVICAGGKYLAGAWVCINRLRSLGCTLPVQLWHLNRREMDDRMRRLLRPLGVECVDASLRRRRAPARIPGGWELKAYALLENGFREVLLLDADNVPVVNPEYLFELPEYTESGAVFWPDYDHGVNQNLVKIWRSCGLRPPKEPEFESGQILVDKARCWRALRLALWFNEHSDFYYQFMHGDKDTFHVAFRRLRQAYRLVPKPIHPLPGTMCQHDFHGRRVFQHRNGDKWDLFHQNRRVPDFLYEDECLQLLEQLRDLWDGGMAQARRLWPKATKSRGRSGEARIEAFLLSSSDRDQGSSQTRGNLSRTDWGDADLRTILLGRDEKDGDRQAVNGEALRKGLKSSAEYLLLLEEDLVLNLHLRHNLLHWHPLRARIAGVAGLLNSKVRETACDLRHNARLVHPERASGFGALVVERRLLEKVLDCWARGKGTFEQRLFQEALRRKEPVYYHAPSLAQRISTPRPKAEPGKRAFDFQREWKVGAPIKLAAEARQA